MQSCSHSRSPRRPRHTPRQRLQHRRLQRASRRRCSRPQEVEGRHRPAPRRAARTANRAMSSGHPGTLARHLRPKDATARVAAIARHVRRPLRLPAPRGVHSLRVTALPGVSTVRSRHRVPRVPGRREQL
eukprot:3441813-Prymnesium_polylepis.1